VTNNYNCIKFIRHQIEFEIKYVALKITFFIGHLLILRKTECTINEQFRGEAMQQIYLQLTALYI